MPFGRRAPWYVLLEFSAIAADNSGKSIESLLGDALRTDLVRDAAIAATAQQEKDSGASAIP